MALPRFVVRAAARAKPLVPDGAWPTLLAARSLAGDAPLLTGPPTGRVLSLSAHPDDDTIGCAGTLALAVRAGATATAAMATSGDASIGSAMDQQDLAAAREADARRAYGHLGVTDVRFLGLPDGHLDDDPAALREALGALVREVRPTTVLVPWALDGHRDHRAVHRALLACDLDRDLEVWGYEVWTPLPPNRHVEITAAVDAKRAALAEHRTASAAFDVASLAALSRYRAGHALMGRGEAEAFLVGTPDELRRLLDQLDRADAPELP